MNRLARRPLPALLESGGTSAAALCQAVQALVANLRARGQRDNAGVGTASGAGDGAVGASLAALAAMRTAVDLGESEEAERTRVLHLRGVLSAVDFAGDGAAGGVADAVRVIAGPETLRKHSRHGAVQRIWCLLLSDRSLYCSVGSGSIAARASGAAR